MLAFKEKMFVADHTFSFDNIKRSVEKIRNVR